MSVEPAGAWPLSAAATAVLRRPRTPGGDVLRLALKELVLRKCWTLRVERRRGMLGREKVTRSIVPGEHPVPPMLPLRELDRVLRRASGRGGELTEVVRAATKESKRLGRDLRDEARRELAARELVELRRERALGLVPYTKVVPTPSGQAWERAAGDRMTGLAGADAARVAALGGLVLLLDPAPLAELDVVLQRLRDRGDGGGGDGGSSGWGDGDLDLHPGDLDVLDELDSGFDSDVDSGGGDGDGGGDGGGD